MEKSVYLFYELFKSIIAEVKMKVIPQQEITRENILSIIFFETEKAPFIVMGEAWQIAAAAINRDDNIDQGYFVGFQNIVQVKVNKIPNKFNEQVESYFLKWLDHTNSESFLSGQPKIDPSTLAAHFVSYSDKKQNYTWGLCYFIFTDR